MVLSHPDRRRLYVYNHPAHLLWRALRAGDTASLPRILVSRYGVPWEVAKRDVDAIVSQWVDNGLVVVGSAFGEDTTADVKLPSDALDISPRRASKFYRFGTRVFGVSAEATIEAAIAPLLAHLRVDAAEPCVSCVIGTSGAGRGFLASTDRWS